VAGDAVDLAMLGAAARKSDNPGGLAFATAMVLGITALDVMYAIRLQGDQSSAAARARSAGRAAVKQTGSLANRIGSLVGL
jgi:hypothetical protein